LAHGLHGFVLGDHAWPQNASSTMANVFKTLRGTWVEALGMVDWEAQRGQYLTGVGRCATLEDAFKTPRGT